MHLIHPIDGIVWEADAASLRFTFVSPQAEQLLGYPASAWIEQPDFWREHVHPDDRDAAVALHRESATRKASCEREYRMCAHDGREVWLRDIVVFHQEEGAQATLRGVLIDITESRAQARALARMTGLYAALSRISEAVPGTPSEAALFGRICEALVAHGGLSMAWIGWDDPATHAVEVVARAGDAHHYLDAIVVRSDRTPEGQGPIGIAIREGRSCVLNDFLHTPGTEPWRATATRSGFRSVGAFPIRKGGRACGALAGYANERDFFGADEIELLERAVGHLSSALDHQEGLARRRQAEDALRQSEARFRVMFEHTADALLIVDRAGGGFTDCNQAAVDLLERPDKASIRGLHLHDVSPPRQPEGQPSEQLGRAMIATAIENGSHRFEWMLRASHRGSFPVEVLLTPIQVDSEQFLIATVRDITQRRRNERTQSALHQISEAAQSATTLAEMFARIHQIVDGLLPVRNFFVALYDEASDELSFPCFIDEIDAPPDGPMRLGDGTLSGDVIRSGRSLLLDPEARRERAARGLPAVGAGSLDWLGVPLKSGTRTFGALVVQSYSGDVRYSERDKELLEIVSAQVASAIVRKQSEQALRASEFRFRLLFEQNQAGVYRTRTDGTLLECNESFARLLGYASKDEIMRANARDFYFADGRGTNRETALAAFLERGSVSNLVLCLRRKDGREVWGIESATLIRGEHGEPDVIQGTIIDFTERKRAEEELRRSETRLEEAQRMGHLGSWSWDLASNTLRWSDELCRIYGVDPDRHVPGFEDFIGRVHPEDRANVQALVGRALRERRPFSHELRIVRPDGGTRTLFDRGEVVVDALGEPTALAGACLDITARKMEALFERDRSAILEQIVQGHPLPDVLSRLAVMLEAQMPGTRSSVLLLRDGRLRTGAAPHLPGDYSLAIDGLPPGPATGSCGTACHTGQPVITEDIATDPAWEGYRQLALPHGLRACWSIPIPASAGGVLGSLAVYRDQPSLPQARELDFMNTAAQLASVAIEHRLLTDRLEHQAQHDALTGLPNRVLFRDRLRQGLAQAQRRQQQLAILYMDLDRFKNVNDTFGHSAGDALLQQAALRLGACIRDSDTLARLGGDEFIVLVTEMNDARDTLRVATELIDVLRQPFQVEGHEAYVSVSMGISVYPADGLDGDLLIAHADTAMYRAKELGRDNFQWFAPEMNALARERMDLEIQLRHALRLGQLSLHYQPLCNAGGAILGFEALMRWNHPTLGSVSPGRFIPLAEESGLIVPMGEWALREACAQLAAWRRDTPGLRVAVNVSAVQFRRADWVDTVVRALRDTGLEPSALELEITESLILQSVTETSENLFGLRALGVGIAIDDFGTGYSSLSYLHKLPVTTLKIDQSFVREIGAGSIGDRQDAPVIRTIIALARNFGLGIVAEGVETAEQRDLLVQLGCDCLQGYLLHRPLTAEQAGALLLARREGIGAGCVD